MAVIPIFYLNTATDVVAIPEPVIGEPHSARVTFVSVPSLEAGVDAAGRMAVVTLMISGAVAQTRVLSSGDVFTYSTSLYVPYTPPAHLGLIYVRATPGSDLDTRRVSVLQALNTPDYEVVGLPDGVIPPLAPGDPIRKTVQVADEAMIRLPIREIERQFSSIFSSAGIIIAPFVATFTNFGGSLGTTTFIALPDSSHFAISSSLGASNAALLSALPSLEQADQWQPPIKMTSTSWTVFGILWAGFAISFLISVGVAYGWYIAHYL